MIKPITETGPGLPADDLAERASRILVVDDQALSRELVVEILALQGYETVPAADGPSALELARDGQFDLILLDISMPGMSGLEVCRALRAVPATAAIPIIAVTGLAHREQRLEGIAAGANDYLTKPVDRSDLLLRVRNALALSRCHRRLATQYERLRDLEALRDGLVHMLVHDLKGPLTGVVYVLDAMRRDIHRQDHSSLAEDVEAVLEQTTRLTAMVNDVLDVSRAESVGMPVQRTAFEVTGLVREAIDLAGMTRRAPAIEIISSGEVYAFADPGHIRRAVANLIGNADKFSRTGAPVAVTIADLGEAIRIEVADHGPGVPAGQEEAVFAKFTRASGAERRTGVGLGLTFCRMAVEANGGRIGVISEPGRGATFWLTIPAVTASVPHAAR